MMASRQIAKNRFNRKALALVLAWVANFSTMHAALAGELTQFQLGVKSYNSKHYSEAIGYLQNHLSSAPNDSVARYYLANALQTVGCPEKSLLEYNRALVLSTSPQLTQYCRQAIQRSVKERSNTLVLNVEPSTFGFVQQRVAIREDVAVSRALNRIKDQSNERLEIYDKNGAAEIQSIHDHLAMDIIRFERDRDSRIQAILDYPQSVMKGKSSSSTTVDAAIQKIRTDTDQLIQNAKLLSEDEIKQHQQQSLDQNTQFKSDVKNWQSQVSDSLRQPGMSSLQAVGTDLYTRVYNVPIRPPVLPPEEMLATPERLVLDAHSRPGRTISRVVRDPSDSDRPAPPGTDLRVHGLLMRH